MSPRESEPPTLLGIARNLTWSEFVFIIRFFFAYHFGR